MSTTKTLKLIFNILLLLHSLPYSILADTPLKHIAITQFVEHTAADAVRLGLLEELAKKGYREGHNITVTFENAQGNAATAAQIARKFIGLHPDVIIAITTPSAQAMVKTIGKEGVPIVFSAVTDPITAGLVSSLQNQKEKVTGVMDAPPLKEQLNLIKTLLPTAKTLGVIYNPGDSGSVSSLTILRKQAKEQGLTLVESTPVKSSDIQSAFLHLIGKVDAVYIPLDNMLVSAMSTVSSLALKHNIPLFSADSGSVEAGALACVGYSYHQTGSKTGEIVTEILKGKNPSEIPIASPEAIDIYVNRNAAEKLKISLSEAIRTQAHFY